MKAIAKLIPNEDQEFSITMTAPVSDWKALLKQMRTEGWAAWPASSLVSVVRGVIEDLDKTYEKMSGES